MAFPISGGSAAKVGMVDGADSQVVKRTLDFEEEDLEVVRSGCIVEPSLQGALLACSDAPIAGRVYWEAFFVVVPIFSGYAALFGLQHEIKVRFGIHDNSSSASHDFSFACSFLYIFNFIFRFAHNIVFGCMGARGRTFVAMGSMVAAMLVIAVLIMLLESYHLGWVVLAYCLGGMSIGSFESNFLSCLTPFGHRSKHLAITGIPVGISLLLVGGFFVMGAPLQVPATALYFAVAVGACCGMIVIAVRFPNLTNGAAVDRTAQPGFRKFRGDVKQFRRWLPQLWTYPVATMIDMFVISAGSPGVALYIYDKATVTLAQGWVLQTTSFFAIFNVCNMLGGLTGRWLSYRVHPRHPVLYTVFSAVGVVLLLVKVPLLAFPSTFLVMLGDGLIYGSISRHIDTNIPQEFNLVALSFWLFVGDIGSVTGSNLISYIRDWVVGN